MKAAKSQATEEKRNEFVITRTFDASRAAVWNAWTDPEQMKKWWGPKNFTAPVVKIDFRVGGKYLSCMRGPDGKDYWSTGVYKEIDAPQRLVVTDSFADEKGNPVPASYYGMGGDWPEELTVTLKLDEQDGETTMTLTHAGIPVETREMCIQGWNESFDKLAASLK
jgi:uncharacterized protein YndB with AHSA1/START domain